MSVDEDYRIPYAFFVCGFQHSSQWITDDINQLSFLTWSTSRYRVRDLPTFGHIPNKSRSLGDIGKVACSVTPSPTCPLKCFVAISLKNSRAKLTCIVLSFPVTTPPKVGSCVALYTGVLLLTSPMTSTSCLFWHGRRRGTGFVICLPWSHTK